MKINGETQIIGFVGSTYRFSKMYALYNAAFKAMNLNYIYIPFIVSDLKPAIDGIRNLGIKGIGVTIPYKVEIIKYIDELDENAKRIGAVNVVINHNGKLIGGNTDGLGAVKALKEKIRDLKNKKVLLLGAGGAARALAFTLKDEKVSLTVLNRTTDEAVELSKRVGCNFDNLTNFKKIIADNDIVINSTCVGMQPNINESLVVKELLTPKMTIMDLVTNPKETKLVKDAKDKGCRIVYGDRMLFWQAVLKFKIFTGVDAPVKVMEKALSKIK